MDIVYDNSAIQGKGGEKAAYKRVTYAGADLSTPDTWHDLPEQSKLDFNFGQPEKAVTNRKGNQVGTDLEDVAFEITFTVMQDDVTVEEFLMYEVPGTYFALFSEHGFDAASKTKERFVGINKIERNYSSTEPERRPTMKFIPQVCKTAVTPATVPSWAKGAASSFVIAAGRYHKAVATT